MSRFIGTIAKILTRLSGARYSYRASVVLLSVFQRRWRLKLTNSAGASWVEYKPNLLLNTSHELARPAQFTNLLNCTLIANPIAMNVAISDARPALISGSGTPMTGNIPSAIPMFMKI